MDILGCSPLLVFAGAETQQQIGPVSLFGAETLKVRLSFYTRHLKRLKNLHQKGPSDPVEPPPIKPVGVRHVDQSVSTIDFR